jgi:hypothetical protein
VLKYSQIKTVLYHEVNNIENLQVKFDSFVKPDVLLSVRLHNTPFCICFVFVSDLLIRLFTK